MAKTATKTVMTFPEKSPYRPGTAEDIVAAGQDFAPLAGDDTDIQERVESSLETFKAQGVPTPKLERWKYTNLARAVKKIDTDYSGVAYGFDSDLIRPLSADDLSEGWVRDMVLSAPPQEDKYQDWACWHMANVFLKDGLVIDIPDNYTAEEPLDIESLVNGTGIAVSRILINVGTNAELTIVENIKADGEIWLNALAQINIQKGGRLRHYRLHELADDSVYTQSTHVRVQRDATYETFAFFSGNRLIRHQIHVELQGQNGTCNLYGIKMLDESRHADTTITIEHQAPHCNSNQFYRSVLDDRARGVFQGKVHVHQAAQKTDGYQLANTLILSEGAEMDTKPELEIYADDVKCSHGATTGQLDKEALFYLTSRGIEHEEARALLIEAFVREAVDRLADNVLTDSVNRRIRAWMDK